MTSKIVEVLTKILEGLNNNYSLEEVNKILLKEKKFDQKTVSVAFSLIFDKVLTKKTFENKAKNKRSEDLRILSEEEREILGLENYNYLLHLINVGLIDSKNVETILEQVMMFPETQITKSEINWIILLSLVDFNSEILPGSRVLLYSSDTIN
ncbi:DUF494 family protein [Melioribacteraceae bacterium 4301-Me]|uniref:DUF494 family protein n=1 Tax=Pyranulibacter aquaticus TaxID=3163344 RepID=UPI00359AE73E